MDCWEPNTVEGSEIIMEKIFLPGVGFIDVDDIA